MKCSVCGKSVDSYLIGLDRKPICAECALGREKRETFLQSVLERLAVLAGGRSVKEVVKA